MPQLRFDDVDGYRVTAFATNTKGGQLADLKVRHRSRARCEDRIRIAKDSGLRNFPLKGFDQNQIWLAVIALAGEIEAWKSLLAFPDHEIRKWGTEEAAHARLRSPGDNRENSAPGRRSYEGDCPLGWNHRCWPRPVAEFSAQGQPEVQSLGVRVRSSWGGRAGVGSPQGRGETRWSCHARMAESVSVRGNGAEIIGNQLPMKNRG